jgi:Mannosyltransferase (PIG-V)
VTSPAPIGRRAPATPDRPLPRGATVLDAVTVALALVAVSAYVTGGFRTEVFGLRVSATSWLRVVVAALVVAVVRHMWRRSPSLPGTVLRGLTRWRHDEVTRATWPIVVTTRIGVLVIGLLAVYALGYPQGAPPFRVAEGEVANLPARFDTGWYLSIATTGYEYTPNRFDRQQNIVFFPAFPVAMQVLSLFVARQLVWSGVLVSFIAFAVALRYLFRLARELMDTERAAVTVTLLSVYPFAVFFSAPYTEGLFLATMLGAWWHARRDERWRAVAYGLVAGLTRPNGCLLSVPLALAAVLPLWRGGRLQRPVGGWWAMSDRLVVAAAPGLGMLLYSAFVYDMTGDPFMWVRLQAAWGRENLGVVTFLGNEWERAGSEGAYRYVTNDVPLFLNAFAGMCALASIVPVWRRFGAPLGVLVAVNLLPALGSGGWLSVGRGSAVLFPIFLWLAAVVPAGHRQAWVAGFSALQGLAAALFFTWRQLF